MPEWADAITVAELDDDPYPACDLASGEAPGPAGESDDRVEVEES